MNKSILKLVSIAMIATMVLSAFPIFMQHAKAIGPPPAFWLVPVGQSFTTPPTVIGTTFTETLWVATAGDTFTYQYEIDFNTAQLICSGAVYTSPPTSQFFAGHTSVATGPTIDNLVGTVSGGETLLGADVVHATPGGATIITMTFQVMALPPPGTTLTSLIHINPDNSYLLDPDLATVPNVSFTDATYSNQWVAPTAKPYVEDVNLTNNFFSQSFIWVPGTTFDLYPTIQNLDPAWFLNSVVTNLKYNATVVQVMSVTFDPAWTGATSYTITIIGDQGDLNLAAASLAPISTASVIIAKVTMKLLIQQTVPPAPSGYADVSGKHLANTVLTSFYGAIGIIAQGPEKYDGDIVVQAYNPVSPPYLSVDGGYIIGPTPSVGLLFNVTVTLHNVVDYENLIGIQYRLQYDSNVLQFVASYEGPFFPDWAALEPGSLGTFFYDAPEVPDGIYGPHDLVGHMIFPNGTGQWNAPMPSGTGVITIITFKVIYQSFGEASLFSALTIADQLAVGLDNLVNQNIVPVPLLPPVNGNVTITNSWYVNPLNPAWGARFLDVYGGAVNSGLIQLDTQTTPQFVPPYGGQGLNMPMDLVEPQSWVYLNANVTYNYWPVQHKLVAFEVDMPNGTVYTKLFAFSDNNGVAMTGFRMPWPCVNPESLFGADPEEAFWKVTATVELADVIINDTMTYHYDYLMHIFKVTTDAFQYNHGDCVGIYVDYGSLAGQTYPAELLIKVVDNLGVTIGSAVVQTTIGNAWTQGSTMAYKNFTAYVNIPIPKWAYAGIAHIEVDGFNAEPAQGGVAITPEYVGPTIAIQPY